MTPRSAQARLTMATNRAPLDFRIFPSWTARFTRLRASKMMFLGTLDANRVHLSPPHSYQRAKASSPQRADHGLAVKPIGR